MKEAYLLWAFKIRAKDVIGRRTIKHKHCYSFKLKLFWMHGKYSPLILNGCEYHQFAKAMISIELLLIKYVDKSS